MHRHHTPVSATKPVAQLPGKQPRLVSLPDTGYIREREMLATFVPIGKTTLWRRVKDGSFPKPVKLSPKVTAWRIEDVRAWINSRGAQ